MANIGKITIELDPIVKMDCKNRNCKNNLANGFFKVGLYCNLKHIQLDENGKCEMYEPKDDDDEPT